MPYIPTNFTTTAVINADTLFQNYDDEVQVLMSDVGDYLTEEMVKVYTETETIVTDGIKVNSVETIEDLATQDGVVFKTIIVKDLNRGGTFIWSSTGTANGGTVFAGVSGYWNRQYSGAVNVKWFGATSDYSSSTFSGTDNTAAFTAAINYCTANGIALHIQSGYYFFNGGKLNIPDALLIYGDGKESTVLVFGGAPIKQVITRVKWQSSYDSGDYSTNIDTPVSYAVRISNQNVKITNMSIITNHNKNQNYTTPFDAATDFALSSYDYGVITHYANTTLDNVNITGVWANSGLVIDGSNIGGFGDGFNAYDCDIFGFWGAKILGAEGQPISGYDFYDLVPLDTRTSGGVSDINFYGCNIGDIARDTRVYIDGIRKIIRFSETDGGGLYINGQVAANTAQRIQGIKFNNCRISSANPFVYLINYAHRVEFQGCHSEYLYGGYKTDGVTLLGVTDCSIATTLNSRKLLYIGGEKSGETDARVFKNTTLNLQLINEYGFQRDPSGPVGYARMLQIDRLSDIGLWTPTLYGSVTAGSPTYTIQFGMYAKIGNMVFAQCRVQLLTKGDLAGSVILTGLPFTASTLFGNSQDAPACLAVTSSVTTGDAGTGAFVNDNTKNISFVKLRSGATFQPITALDIVDTSRFDLSIWYMTEDA